MFDHFDHRSIPLVCAIAWMVAAIAMLACTDAASSGTPSTSSSCAFQMGGAFTEPNTLLAKCISLNYQDATDVDDAGTVSPAGWILVIDGTAPDGSQILVNINVGATPASGDYSSETLVNWYASVDNRLDSGMEAVEAAAFGGWSAQCVYIAGTSWVPSGSFVLHLDSVTTTGTPSAHGTLSLVTYAHAPAEGNCGSNETENVAVDF
jgi:hypothetical protein